MTEQGKGILRRALCLLREIEWEGCDEYNEGDEMCPSCGGLRYFRGHTPGCNFVATLRDLESLLDSEKAKRVLGGELER